MLVVLTNTTLVWDKHQLVSCAVLGTVCRRGQAGLAAAVHSLACCLARPPGMAAAVERGLGMIMFVVGTTS
jgi:hypothetical protein